MMLVDLLSWLVLGGIRSEARAARGEVDHESFRLSRVVLAKQFLCELVFRQRWPLNAQR